LTISAVIARLPKIMSVTMGGRLKVTISMPASKSQQPRSVEHLIERKKKTVPGGGSICVQT